MENRKRKSAKWQVMHDIMPICTVHKTFTSLGQEPVIWTDEYIYGRTLRINGARERYILLERSNMSNDLRINISTWDNWNDMIYWLQQTLRQTVESYVKVDIVTTESIWFGLMSIWPYVKLHVRLLEHGKGELHP